LQDVDLGGVGKVKPLAIIAPEVMSIPISALSDDDIDELFKKYSVTHDVRLLVKKRPQGLSTKDVNAKYLFGYTFGQCVSIMMQAKLFIGNDSGLAWVALYNRECKKIIYHHRKRLNQTNVWYEQLDPLAKDVVVEGKWE